MVQKRDGVLPHDASHLYIVSNKNDSYKKGSIRGQKRTNELLVVAKQTGTALGSRLYIARVKVTRSRVRKL